MFTARDGARYWRRIAIFANPTFIRCSHYGWGSRRNVVITCGVETLHLSPDGEKSFMICLFVSTEYTNVTDRRTGRQTNRHRTMAEASLMSSIAKFNFLAQTRRKWRFFIHQAFDAPPPLRGPRRNILIRFGTIVQK